MTPSTILAIAEKHSAYPDTAMTIRGKADILAFAEELLSFAESAPSVQPSTAWPLTLLEELCDEQVDRWCGIPVSILN